MKDMKDLHNYNTVIEYYFAYFKQIRTGLVLVFCRVLVVAPIPFMVKLIIDSCVNGGSYLGIFSIITLATVLLLLHYAFSVSGIYHIGTVIARASIELRSIVFNRIQLLSFASLDRNSAGKLLSKYSFDTQRVEETLITISDNVIPDLLYGISVLFVLIILDWRLSIVPLSLIPIYFFTRFCLSKRLSASYKALRLAREEITGKATEIVSALRLFKTLGTESVSSYKLSAENENLAAANQVMIRHKVVFWTVMYVIKQLLSLLVIGAGAVMVVKGQLTLGSLVAYLVALPFLLLPLDTLAVFSDVYCRGEVSYQSIREFTDEHLTESWGGEGRLRDLKGEIHFENVSFHYPSKPSKLVLKSFSIHIKPGENIAIVGTSGSGKSTLVSLVLGLYDIQCGDVKIDGISISNLSLAWLRQQCAIVPQETILLSGSISDNIKLSRQTATPDEIQEAAKIAHADDFIRALPSGYDTIVGERGVGLSGGQRQRISIARAILRRPKILIFDEATSSLDNESEKLIQDAMENFRHKCTLLTIAHRFSTIRNADRIIVLDKGRILGEGTYEELIRVNGLFKRLAGVQSTNFTDMFSI